MSRAPESTRTAFDALVAEHQRAVLGICRSILRDEHLGADAAQETFVRLWKRLDAAREPEAAGPWLRRVAVSTALDLARRRRVRADADARRGADERSRGPTGTLRRGDADVSDEPGPERAAANAELARRLDAAVARLPEGQRTVFRLRHHAGLPLAEVAATLGLALPTVKTQFARACLKLHDALLAHRDHLDD